MQVPNFLLQKNIDQIVSLDFETYYSSTYTLKNMSTSLYIFDEQFLVHGVAININGETNYYDTDEKIRKALKSIDWNKSAVLGHHCLTPDTEVLTQDGWKEIHAVTAETQIMQWDAESNTATWVTPLNKIETNANTINVWDSNFHQGAYTDEHRMYYSTPNINKWRSAKCSDIKKLAPNSVYIPKSGLYKGSTSILDIEAQLLEAIRADGNLVPTTDAVRFNLKKLRKINRLKQILNNLSLSYKETINNETGKHAIYVHSCNTLKEIRKLFNKNKVYGKKIQELSLTNRVTILEETQYWDGHIQENGSSINVSSIDKQTIDTLQIIAHTSGWSANYHKERQNNWKTKNTLYGISLRKTNKCKLQYKPKEQNYSGKVYCFTVPSKAFFIRRNNVINITGNCHFDCLILFFHYKITPAYYLDTLSMARPVLQNKLKKLDLNSIAKHLGISGKLEGLEDTKNKRILTKEEDENLAKYCINDVDITVDVFNILLPYFTDMELDVINYTVKMYANPVLVINEKMVDKEIHDIQLDKKKTFELAKKLFPKKFKDRNVLKVLRSSDQFATVLKYNGITVPIKKSPTTNLPVNAFARTDLDFQAFEFSDNEDKQLLYKARIKSKSDTALNKAIILRKFAANKCCPVYLNYWRAQTGRWSGGDKLQLQNLPRNGAARLSLEAPPGHYLLVCDLSQIELRMSAWFSDQLDVLSIFAKGLDVYKDMATKIYNIKYDDVTKDQRMVAKVTVLSLGYGAGIPTFDHMLKAGIMGPKVNLSLSEVSTIHSKYRHSNKQIVKTWARAGKWLECLVPENKKEPITYKGVTFSANKVTLPNGTFLLYPDIQITELNEVSYMGANGMRKYIYPALFFENIIQALARAVMAEHLVKVAPLYDIVLSVHDELVVNVIQTLIDKATQEVEAIMRTSPEWCKDLPLDCESGYAIEYSK